MNSFMEGFTQALLTAREIAWDLFIIATLLTATVIMLTIARFMLS